MTVRLVASVKARWASFDGWGLSRGIDVQELNLDRFLNLVYYWLTKDAESEKDIRAFDAKLFQPPKGTAAPAGSPWSPEGETAAFDSFLADVGS